MKAPDYFDRYEADEQEAPSDKELACKSCGDTWVHWSRWQGKWRLFSDETGKPHVCPLPDATDDFKKVPK